MNHPTGPASAQPRRLSASPLLRSPAPGWPHVAIAWASCILGITVLASGCGAKAATRQPRVPVTVARVERRTVPFELVSTGTVEAIHSASVGSQVGGTVTSLAIREGREVRAGQLLIQLDTRPFRAELDQARGALGRDRAQWESARADAERAKTLFDQGLLA